MSRRTLDAPLKRREASSRVENRRVSEYEWGTAPQSEGKTKEANSEAASQTCAASTASGLRVKARYATEKWPPTRHGGKRAVKKSEHREERKGEIREESWEKRETEASV
ncbi:uncharacterized protein LOC117240032 [Bombus vosnesenskii]|uniref:Uncharacterized protein LOC117240032 n=1 Tax=Bombus vosnesenskii TaxID=207650 RepID=A0A6J3L8Y0_9HYME|nr:uncharacterized protein LOC117240032 [Bombus vosnesenskii]